MQLRSKEEEYFYWWLLELEENGVIEDIRYEDKSFKLFDSRQVEFEKTTQLKTKTKVELINKDVIGDHSYTPDFNFKVKNDSFLFWIDYLHVQITKETVPYTKFFLFHDSDSRCYIEVKGNFDKNNMTRAFKINQKWMLYSHFIFVNLIKIPNLFKETFTPRRYLTTDKTGKARKINFKVKTVEEFLNENLLGNV